MMKYVSLFLLTFFHAVSSVSAADWYIDNAAKGANNGTSWENAWTNFATVKFRNGCAGIDVSTNAVHAGDTIFISGGETSKVYFYTNNGSLCVGGVLPGDSYTNVTFIRVGQDPGHNGVAIFDGTGQDFYGRSYFQIGNGSNVVVSGNYKGNTNFVFRNITSSGSRTTGAAVAINAPHVTLEFFCITNAANGIEVQAGSTDVEIRYGAVLGTRRDHSILTQNSGGMDSCRVHHCLFISAINSNPDSNSYGVLWGGPDIISNGSPITVHDCEFKFMLSQDIWNPAIAKDMQHPDVFQGMANNSKIYNNIIHNPPGAVFEQQPPNDGYLHDIIIANNLIVYDQPLWTVSRIYESGYITPLYAISNIYWLNNTMVDFPSGMGQAWQQFHVNGQTNQPVIRNWVMYNNISVSNNPAAKWMGFGGYYNKNFTTNNILTTANVAIGSSKMAYATNGIDYIQNPQEVYWIPEGTITSLPEFVSYSYKSPSNDFHLKSSDMVARRRGTNLTALFAKLGIPATDLDGNARPSGGNWDIGVYQFSDQEVSNPAPPTRLSIKPAP